MWQPWRSTLALLLTSALAATSLGILGPSSPASAAPASAGPVTGTVVAWGYNAFGQTTVPATLTGVTEVASGAHHSLVLESDGTVVSWGHNTYGQATVPAGLSEVTALAGGCYHSLALRNDGAVVGWGLDTMGQVDVPAGLTDAVAIAAGCYHSLAVKADGTVLAWGEALFGKTDVPPGLSGVVAVAAGAHHSLALKADGTVVAWGSGGYGQTSVPPGLTGVTDIAAGGYFSLALKSDGTVVAWGSNSWGERTLPAGLSGVTAISAGFAHGLALRSDGTVVAWGRSDEGETAVPAGLSGVTGIAAGYLHNLALVADPSEPAALSVEKDADTSRAAPGDVVSYTLRVRNAGPGDAEDVVVTDLLPGGTTYVDASAPCTHTGHAVTCHLGTLAAGAAVPLTLRVRVEPLTAANSHRHQLDVTKVESHLSLPAGATSTATATCPTGYLAVDGSVRLDAVDQDGGDLSDLSVLESRSALDGSAWIGLVHNAATGQAQVKVNVVCLSARTTSGDAHSHPVVPSSFRTQSHAWTTADSWATDPACATGSMAVAPSFAFTAGSGSVSTRRTLTGWHFRVDASAGAAVAVSMRCLSTTTGDAAGHRHDLGFSQLSGTATVPAGGTTEQALTCPEGHKGLVSWADLAPGLVALGTDPQPVTRLFRFLNPTTAPLTADYGLLCLAVRTPELTVTNTATVATSSADTTPADDADSVSFTVTATGVLISPTATVLATPGRTRVAVRLLTTRPRYVTVRLSAVGPVPGTDLVRGDLFARRAVQLVEGGQGVRLVPVDEVIAGALRKGQIDRARLVVVRGDGIRTTQVVRVSR